MTIHIIPHSLRRSSATSFSYRVGSSPYHQKILLSPHVITTLNPHLSPHRSAPSKFSLFLIHITLQIENSTLFSLSTNNSFTKSSESILILLFTSRTAYTMPSSQPAAGYLAVKPEYLSSQPSSAAKKSEPNRSQSYRPNKPHITDSPITKGLPPSLPIIFAAAR